MRYETIDPATGECVARFPTHDDAAMGAALDRAASAFADWSRRPVDERVACVEAIAAALESEAGALGELMALEMGKPVSEGEAEARKCAWACRYFAENGPSFLAEEAKESDGSRAYVRFDPLGPVLAIMPWNFPFWQFFRFAAPTLVAGNVVLLKHAPNTPQCAARIESLVAAAGVPAGVVGNLYLSNEQAAELIADPRVRGVTLTGSTRAGREVASTAGRHLKSMVMELGGSDPFIVLNDADLERAVEVGVASRCLNNGQSCIAAKRFLVHASVYDRFRDAFVDAMRGRRTGDPRDPEVELGPIAREDLRDGLAEQVGRLRDAGAEVLCGGTVPDGPGFFYPATVVEGVPTDADAAGEELFGPVATLFRFDGDEAMLAIANGTDYGLGASLWTRDRARAEELIPRIDSGSVFVNGLVKSDPRLPFGGIKDSGFGRELAREGMHEFVNRKTVWFA